MCRVLGVLRSGYYAWCGRTQSPRRIEETRLLSELKLVYTAARGNYGTRRIKAALVDKGLVVSRRRIGRLMKQSGLVCKTKRRFKVTTNSKHTHPVAANLLNRNFECKVPDQCYVGDITYVWTGEGWLYVSVVIDLYSRRVVGWSMGCSMKADLVNQALLMALWQRKPDKGLIVHSDRGSQYASKSHRRILRQHGAKQSMSRKGDCWDNAVAESFFKTLKTELVYQKKFVTRDQAKQAIFEYIEVFYNRFRLHSANGYLSPVDFEKRNQLLGTHCTIKC